MPSRLTMLRLYLVTIIALSLFASLQFVESFSSPASANAVIASKAIRNNNKNDGASSESSESVEEESDNNNRRNRGIFVAGISPTSTEQSIRSAFSQFGSIQEVILIGTDHYNSNHQRKKNHRSPYCFVHFEDASSAQRAMDSEAPPPTDSDGDDDFFGYKEIRPATVPMDTRRRRSNESRSKEMDKMNKMKEMGKETNLIIQVQSTHLDRLEGYLKNRYERIKMQCKVLGSTKSANSKNISLLFLSCTSTNPMDLARELYRDPLLARAINKSYVVQPGLIEVKSFSTTEEGYYDAFAKVLYDKICQYEEDENNEGGVKALRMQIFPPKHQSRLFKPLEALLINNNNNNGESEKKFAMDPKAFTHILSVVEVYQYKGRGWERKQHDNDGSNNNRMYMIGISPGSFQLDVVDTNNSIFSGNNSDNGDDVSRAYYKLKEAIETYESTRGTKLNDDLYKDSIALDCGSAPGGWTKYLIEHFKCDKVYSIDPGELSPTVLELKETEHKQMKIQDALPILLGTASTSTDAATGKVKIWVSDMCLHHMEEQCDQLLHAKKQGLLASNAFFVLTLKCIVGHSKGSYDAQVKHVVDKLCESEDVTVEGVEIFHLFSNRSGERTVVGYIL